MKKGFKIILSTLMIVLLVFVSAGCSTQTAGSSNVISLKAAAAEKHKIQAALDVAGVLVPTQTVNIVSKISGQVTSLNLDVGSTVKAGDTLITLETKALDAQLQQAEAALQSAEVAVQSAGDQADQAKINLSSAQKAFDRTKALYDSGAAPQSQLDDVSSKLDIAKKQYEIATSTAQKQAQASVNTAQANINSIKVQLENATITSPINGIITNRNINPGEIASPGAALLTIADTSTLKLKGTVSQDKVPHLQVGQEINVSVDIYPGKVFTGQINNIGPMSVGTGEYFPIEISIKNSGDIKAGLSAHASINMASDEGIIVPVSAVGSNNSQNYVFVIKNNVVSKRTVTIGLKNDKEVQILKGLESGEQVAVTNVNNLFDNMSVNVN